MDRGGVHLTQRGSIFNGEKWTEGSIFNGWKWTGGTFLGGSIFNVTPALIADTLNTSLVVFNEDRVKESVDAINPRGHTTKSIMLHRCGEHHNGIGRKRLTHTPPSIPPPTPPPAPPPASVYDASRHIHRIVRPFQRRPKTTEDGFKLGAKRNNVIHILANVDECNWHRWHS